MAAHYAEQPLRLAPATAISTPPGLQTFSPGSSQDATVTFTNTTGAPATNLDLSLTLPNKWKSAISGATATSKSFSDSVAPDATVSATFKITSTSAPFNGDLVANASWTTPTGAKQSDTTSERLRNVSPVRINEFRISSGPPANATDSFIELYNAGAKSIDLSGWTLTEHPAREAIFSAVKIPSGTKLAAGGFYLLGLSNSGLAVSARTGDTTLHVRGTAGMSAGDTITIDTGSSTETRKIANLGSSATVSTTLWQPLPDGLITLPVGSTNVPVTSVAGFAVGQKIALGYGASYPAVGRTNEKYEVATVTAVGKPGTQAYLADDATAGATNIKVTSTANISVGDKIRLDTDSAGHGIETVTVTHVGSEGTRTNLIADAAAGATNIKVRSVRGLAVGDQLIIGTPANRETVSITTLGTPGPHGAGVDFTPALARPHIDSEEAVTPGTGLDLAAPLRFNHAANLPFSDRGTGITFQPATAFTHSSNEPVQALGTGITLDSPLAHDHAIDAVVRDAAVTSAGYQGKPEPNQWFGGPALSTSVDFFGRAITLREGNVVLRDASGLVVDSLNYGGLVDPWTAEGYQAISGAEHGGCFVAAPGSSPGFGPFAPLSASDTSASRFPDGHDTDSNCTDFVTEPASLLAAPSSAGATNIKIASVHGFDAGQSIRIDAGSNLETAVIANVGTPGATTVETATESGATVIPVASVVGFSDGQTITLDAGANSETAVVASVQRFGASSITVASPLVHAHAAGAQVSGTGITLTSALTHEHASGAQVAGSAATPGAPNRNFRKSQ